MYFFFIILFQMFSPFMTAFLKKNSRDCEKANGWWNKRQGCTWCCREYPLPLILTIIEQTRNMSIQPPDKFPLI